MERFLYGVYGLVGVYKKRTVSDFGIYDLESLGQGLLYQEHTDIYIYIFIYI